MTENDTGRMREVIFVGESSSVDHKAFILGDEVDLNITKISNGFGALKHILTYGLPDLVIMDLLAERINGLHFCYITNRLLEMSYLKVILFSEHSHRNNIIKGIQSGAADYIIDPCSDVLFKDRVLYHLYETPFLPGQDGPDSSRKGLFSWGFLSIRRVHNLEEIFLEKKFPEGRSEIKKLSRDFRKKDFSSVKVGDVSRTEFEEIKTHATGDLSRFVLPEKAKIPSGKVAVEEIPGKEAAEPFGKRKLDVYDVIEPRDTIMPVEPGEPIEKRDRIFDYSDLKEVASSNRDLGALLKVDREISTNRNRQECMFNVVSQISEFIETARTSIIVPDEDGTKGTVLVANDDRTLENLTIDLRKYPEIKRALEKGEIVFIQNVRESELLKSVMNEIEPLGYSHIVVIPIWHGNRVIAVLSVRGMKGGREINYEDIAFCQIIANTTAKTVAGKLFLSKIMEKFTPDRS